jgi:SAM-dependent methyltransferase
MKIDGIELTELSDEFLFDGNTPSIVYGEEYFQKYASYAQTDLGYKINTFRKNYVEIFSRKGEILDYGCGYGTCISSDSSGRWFGYDINPYVVSHLGSRFVDSSRVGLFNTVCFFDSLEHIQGFRDVLSVIKEGAIVVITIPCCSPWNPAVLKNWRHWRPGEHFLYSSSVGFVSYMGFSGFSLVDENKIESSIGRHDILTFCFEKRKV